jgi:hypothetical protein
MDSTVLGKDLYDGLAKSGFGLFVFTLIIIVLCVIFITTFNDDCKVVSYENDVINVVIQIISITSGVLCLFSIPTILAGFNKAQWWVNVITTPLFKPFWAILCTIISIVFLVSSIWMYRVISAKDFICGKRIDGECGDNYNCVDSFCQSSESDCTENCSQGETCISKDGVTYHCSNHLNKTCSPGCNIGRTCINGNCQDAKPCTSMDDLSSNPPVYTESHKTLFHCAAGLITMSCIFLVYSIYELWDWLHETTEQKYEKVNNIIKDFEANPDSITQSKLKAIDDLLSDPSESKDIKEGYKIIASAKEAREKIKVHIESRTREIERIEETNKLNSISDYYIRKYKKETDIVEKKKILSEICTNHASLRTDIVNRIKLVVKDGWIDTLDGEKLDKLCRITDKSSSDAIDIEGIKGKWSSIENAHSGDTVKEYSEKFKKFKEIIKDIKNPEDIVPIRKEIQNFDSEFFKKYPLSNTEMLNVNITNLLEVPGSTTTYEDKLNLLETFCKSEKISEERKIEILTALAKSPSFEDLKDFCYYGKDYYNLKKDIKERINKKDSKIDETNELIQRLYDTYGAKKGDDLIKFMKQMCKESTSSDILCLIDKEFSLVKKDVYNKFETALVLAQQRGIPVNSQQQKAILVQLIAQDKNPSLPQLQQQAPNPSSSAVSSTNPAAATASSSANLAAAAGSPFRAKKKLTKRH